MVFHNQSESIADNLKKFEDALSNCAFKDNCVYTGPIIRHEEPYKNLMIDERRKILYCLRSFMLACKLKQYKSMYPEQNEIIHFIGKRIF